MTRGSIMVIVLTLAACSQLRLEEWVPLFNGKNLDGWTIKMGGQELISVSRHMTPWNTGIWNYLRCNSRK